MKKMETIRNKNRQISIEEKSAERSRQVEVTKNEHEEETDKKTNSKSKNKKMLNDEIEGESKYQEIKTVLRLGRRERDRDNNEKREAGN